MGLHTDPDIILDVTLDIQHRDDHLTARVMPLGLRVFANDIDGIVQRAGLAVTLHLKAYQDRGDIIDYLDTRKASYRLEQNEAPANRQDIGQTLQEGSAARSSPSVTSASLLTRVPGRRGLANA